MGIEQNPFFLANYDYCYLESMHWLFNTHKVQPEIVFTGLSYGLESIDCSCISKASLSFCMHSQDIFYDTHHLVDILKNDTEHVVKTVVFALGYYSFHYDLSRTMFKERCLDIYYPLFGTTHNYYATDEQKEGAVSRLSDETFVDEYHSFFLQDRAYFNDRIKRDANANIVVASGGWSKITQDEREKFAKNRALLQNKHIQHKATLEENIGLFYKLCQILSHSGVRIYVMIMPFSREYIRHINPEYKKIVYEILNALPFEVNFIDFNDEQIVDIEDFLDQDHLTTDGSKKFSRILNEVLM